MATVTVLSSTELMNGSRLNFCHVVGTSNYVHETGDYIQYTGVTGSNAIIMVFPCGLSNGGYCASWSNALNALTYFGHSNVGAVGADAHNGQPMVAVGNAVNFATHTFPMIIVTQPS